MATTRSFNAMLNDYLPNKMLSEEIIKRDWFLKNVPQDHSWKGGELKTPFVGNEASSIAFGSLTDSTDIAQAEYVKGYLSDYIEVWGTMLFNQRDLMENDGKIPDTTFLKILPDKIEGFLQHMKEVVSINLLKGPYFAAVSTDSSPTDAANGILTVDKVDRFMVDQKVTLDDDNSSAADYYVTAVDLNNSTVTISATRGSTAANVSAYTAAQNAVFYHDGADSAYFQSVYSLLRTYAGGGSEKVQNVTKTSWPHLQAINIDGSTVTSTNILDKVFDAYTTIRSRARGNANVILMDYTNLGSVMKAIEVQKGGFKTSVGQTTASEYGWTEIEITSVKGTLKIVGIQEMSSSEIFFLDMKSWKFYSNGFFRKRTAPDGKQFFESRATTGYTYIVDISLFGDLACLKPSSNGIMYSISY